MCGDNVVQDSRKNTRRSVRHPGSRLLVAANQRGRLFLATIAAFLLFAAASMLYLRAQRAIDVAHASRLSSYLLADELRQTSDDLTRFVRTYVATGEQRFKDHYQEVLDIREGRKPRRTPSRTPNMRPWPSSSLAIPSRRRIARGR
jgi:hypothetical protein